MLQLSVLDQSPVRYNADPHQALEETVELARVAERRGYSRYWLAEHHTTTGLAGPAPEVLAARLAEATSTIRIGAGGVMLNHYSPLKVAECFQLLEVMYPGRIDLGVGRAPGSDQMTASALAYGSKIGDDYYLNKVADLMHFLYGTEPATKAFADIRLSPAGPTQPEVWVLGSSDQSAVYAAHFGLPYSFAQFISPRGGDEVIRGYKAGFKPSAACDTPRASIGVFVICADTEEEARRLSASRDLWYVQLRRGDLGPYPKVEEALAYEYSPAERRLIDGHDSQNFYGTPEQLKERLTALAGQYHVDELIILTICDEFPARVRSYELLAEAFGLQGPGA